MQDKSTFYLQHLARDGASAEVRIQAKILLEERFLAQVDLDAYQTIPTVTETTQRET
jgi:hypothetical protein